MPYALREALNAFRRAPLLSGLSAAMIGLSLFLLGLFGLVAWNIRQVLRQVESRVEVVAYLRDNADPAAIAAGEETIRAMPQVRDVRYVTRQQALAKAREELPEFGTVFGGLDTNPLPASYEITLQPDQKGPETVEAIARQTADLPFVEDVRYGSEWLDKVYLLRRVAGVALVVLGATFAVVAALIIGAAVRMAIYARRDEIAIMQLVGATDGFIRRPFLLEGMLAGLIGSLLAFGATYATYSLLTGTFIDLAWMPGLWILGGLATGTVLGVFASFISVRRHLRRI
jgi:cell division transport system permease protein